MMERKKLTKEDIDKVRGIEGFPIGTDDDIIALSDAPYFTACPNPFTEDYITENGVLYEESKDEYQREPFAADVSEGKKDPVYNAHSYHTKVPYKAIMRYILHYTNPGDLVFDGFCGTGMTGLAAQMCGVHDSSLAFELTGEISSQKWGNRKAVISDLSPAATYISAVYNLSVNQEHLNRAFKKILVKSLEECTWMYETKDKKGNTHHINYTVWSDVFICPHCGKEIVFWDVAVDKVSGGVLSEFPCPNCNAKLTKKACNRAITTYFDSYIDELVSTTKQVPVLIAYEEGGTEVIKAPDDSDLQILKRIDETRIPYWFPTDRMPIGGESRRNDKYGITHAHHFFTKRNLYVLAMLWDCISKCDEPEGIKLALYSVVTGVMQGVSKLQRFRLNSGFPNNPLTIYGSQINLSNGGSPLLTINKPVAEGSETIQYNYSSLKVSAPRFKENGIFLSNRYSGKLYIRSFRLGVGSTSKSDTGNFSWRNTDVTPAKWENRRGQKACEVNKKSNSGHQKIFLDRGFKGYRPLGIVSYDISYADPSLNDFKPKGDSVCALFLNLYELYLDNITPASSPSAEGSAIVHYAVKNFRDEKASFIIDIKVLCEKVQFF